MMKYWVYPAALLAFVAGCGTPVRTPIDNPEVNIGYGTVRKDDLTSAVSSLQVKDSDIQNYRDMYEYLEGRVAGVMVTPDRRIIIRGIGTINGSTDPLIMVDGYEVQDLSVINPRDVKSVDILKDGSASIYGVRGANGVILITTKK